MKQSLTKSLSGQAGLVILPGQVGPHFVFNSHGNMSDIASFFPVVVDMYTRSLSLCYFWKKLVNIIANDV